jgi:hypothetical protein
LYDLQSLEGYGDLPPSVGAVVLFDLDCITQSDALAAHRRQQAVAKACRFGRVAPLTVYEFE